MTLLPELKMPQDDDNLHFLDTEMPRWQAKGVMRKMDQYELLPTAAVEALYREKSQQIEKAKSLSLSDLETHLATHFELKTRKLERNNPSIRSSLSALVRGVWPF